MFPLSVAAQPDELVGALGGVVSNVTQLDDVVPLLLQQLGCDHRRFSVIAEHYSAVDASLLATLQHFLGQAWTTSLAADWAEAYWLVATVMVQAAEESAELAPAWWPAEVMGVERRTMDETIVQLRPAEPLVYGACQSIAVEVLYRPRCWRYCGLANAPRADESIELHIGLIAGSRVSGPAVRSLRPGNEVRLGASVGDTLALPEDDTRDLVMVAGGPEPSPVQSMLEQLDRRWRLGTIQRVHLFHGARMPWNLYEHAQLTRLTKRPWFSYTPVVSDDAFYPGERGLVGSVAAQHGPWTDRAVLAYGSPGMVAHSVDELTVAGVPAVIRIETFSTNTSVGGQP
jgi:NAD(P)H-flavin reductase